MEQTNEMNNAPVTAQEISGELMEEAQAQDTQEAVQLEEGIREGIAELFEDGWTPDELLALSQDETVRMDVAAGKDIVRAAVAYLRRMLETEKGMRQRRHGVPISRSTAAGSTAQDQQIEQMTDAQFDEFSRRAREAAMMGRKIRM